MVVLLPSYKRTDILPLVIRSVVACDITDIDERIVLLVVNNYFPNKEIVNSIIKDCEFPKEIKCKVIHRKEAKVPIESWFSAIFTVAQEDEVVCLLGDDDILMPWGLKNRYRQITESNADMLLTDYYDHIFFFDKGKQYRLDGDLSNFSSQEIVPVDWEYMPKEHPNASFMSNHCYRNTKHFRLGYETTMTWSRAQSWAPLEIASGNCPFYMAYAIKSVGGSVMAANEKNVLRGSVVEEALIQDYADGGNSAFYALLIYNTFNNSELHEDLSVFDDLRRIYKRSFFGSALTILANENITFSVLYKTMKSSNISFLQIFLSFSWMSLRVVLSTQRWLKKYRLKMRIKSGEFKPVDNLIADLRKG
jgi:hypothetical protein